MPSIQQFQEAATGLSEKAIGLAREVVGTFINNDSLKKAGQAQQRKATERLEAAQREFAADLERAKAYGKEKQQALHQDPEDRSDSGELGRSGPREAVSATAEKVKGKLKTVAGSITGDDEMRREGEVQQDKADHQARAAKEEAKAEGARAKARVAEDQQRAAEG